MLPVFKKIKWINNDVIISSKNLKKIIKEWFWEISEDEEGYIYKFCRRKNI